MIQFQIPKGMLYLKLGNGCSRYENVLTTIVSACDLRIYEDLLITVLI